MRRRFGQVRTPTRTSWRGYRGHLPDLVQALKCHVGVQFEQPVEESGRWTLGRYVRAYVAKFSDSLAQKWLNDAGSAFGVASTVLFRYHPKEPERWLHVADGRQLPLCFYTGAMEPVVAPHCGVDPVPKLQLYERCEWRSEAMSFLDFLRKTSLKGNRSVPTGSG